MWHADAVPNTLKQHERLGVVADRFSQLHGAASQPQLMRTFILVRMSSVLASI